VQRPDLCKGLSKGLIRAVLATQAMEAKRADTRYSLAASYLEIYNEGIFDLLNLKVLG
jgi:hypothetical protein